MKKLIAMLACLTLVFTMFAGLTAMAATGAYADYSTEPTITLERTDDGSTEEIRIAVSYSGFKNFAEFKRTAGKMNGAGFASLGVKVGATNATFQYADYDGDLEPAEGMAAWAYAPSSVSGYWGFNECFLGTLVFTVDDVNANAEIFVIDAQGDSKVYEAGKIVAEKNAAWTFADFTTNKVVIAAAAAPAVDTAVTFDTTGVKGFVANAVTTAVDGTVTIDVTPAYGSKIASVVTTDGEAAYTANGGTITISGLTAETATVTITTAEDDALGVATFAATYVDGDTAYVFGKVPAASKEFGIELDGEKYAAETATAEGVFGVAFIGLKAGSYTATAYAGETFAAAGATIVIAE